MDPGNERGRPPTDRPATNTDNNRAERTTPNGARLLLPSAGAVVIPPCGKRLLNWYVVDPCPYRCGGIHLHRGRNPGEREAGCGKGPYVLTVRGSRRAVAA